MTAHRLWAHSQRDIDKTGRADGAPVRLAVSQGRVTRIEDFMPLICRPGGARLHILVFKPALRAD